MAYRIKVNILSGYVNSRSCHMIRRLYSSKKFSSSLNLPKTKFPLSMKESHVKENEIQQTCDFNGLYDWQRKNRTEKSVFTLHDGPPYANGDPHVGHALNKINKDITNRYRLLKGQRIHYIPGWDCHGMPIEQKALARIKADHTKMGAMEIRKTARSFAEKTIKKQMESFKRWGVMADWDRCYYTFDKQFEAKQLGVFLDLHEKGLIYQDYMPIHWSPASRTALAEAELEYNDTHVSPSVYVKFKLRKLSDKLKAYAGDNAVYLVIWTTTPWTLPLNQAICFGEGIQYSMVDIGGELHVISTECCETLSKFLKSGIRIIANFKGTSLGGTTYIHPLKNNNFEHPVLATSHVTISKGTGLVHTAPAHGTDDFQVAVRHNLSLECHVDEAGCYMPGVHDDLTGKNVIKDGNQAVLSLLKENILYEEEFTHSYPYDWRSKTPCIYRASKQWFVSTSQIKEKALDCLEDVKIYPSTSGTGMRSMLERRPYWCISRQRVWGVPIPVFYHKDTQQVLLNRESVLHIQKLVSEYGTDCWWTLPMETLLPSSNKEQCGFRPNDEFVRGSDVLDIWFDSGSTWAAVLEESGYVSDVYMEGLDQFGGWFQSSLLTCIASQGKAPYRSLVVHGFALDEEGRKMSKSVGNIVDPHHIIHGGKNKQTDPAYGADVLRWWAASVGLDSAVNIGPTVLKRCQEQLYSARKSMRYLLSNLYDFNHKGHILQYSDLLPTDKYMLYKLHDFINDANQSYECFRYDRISRICDLFINTHVSAFYSTVTKDRMYCTEANSISRRSGQTVQYFILEALIKSLAPITPHLCEELYQHPPFNRTGEGSVFKTLRMEPRSEWNNPEIRDLFQTAFSIRDVFFKNLNQDVPVACDVIICAKPIFLNHLQVLQEDEESSHSSLCEILQASRVSICSKLPELLPENSRTLQASCKSFDKDGSKNTEITIVISKAKDYICERCRRYTAVKYGTPCDRCMMALSEGWE